MTRHLQWVCKECNLLQMHIVRASAQREYRANLVSLERVILNKVASFRNDLKALATDVHAQMTHAQRDQRSTSDRTLYRIQQVRLQASSRP